MWMRDLKDKPVVSIAEGTRVGSVHDFLLDDSCSRVVALVVGGGGLLGGRRQAVLYDAIRGIGPDAIMVDGHDAVQEVGDRGPFSATHRQGELDQEVMSEGGVHLGKVKDIEFDPRTAAISAVLVEPKGDWAAGHDGDVAIPRDQIVNLTPKMAIVKHEVVDRPARAVDPALGHDVARTDPIAPQRPEEQRAVH